MESIQRIVENLSALGFSEAIILAMIASLPYLLKHLNDKRLSLQSAKATDAHAVNELAEAENHMAEAEKKRADTIDVITDTSMQWIEYLNKSVAELSARADSSDAANKILLEAKANERMQRKELEASIRIMAEQMEADRAKSKRAELKHQAERDAWTLEKESLKKFWENDRILLMTEVERCYKELKTLIASVEEDV